MTGSMPIHSEHDEADLRQGGAGAEELARMAEFAHEFRELARQRRFVRSAGEAAAGDEATSLRATHAEPAPSGSTTPYTGAAEHARELPVHADRIDGDAAEMLREMARMGERLAQAREATSAATARADRAEADLAGMNDRLLAARALVHDAQRSTRLSAERAAWLEGRCDTLQEALETAVNASALTRWRWRRRMKRS